MELLTGPVLLIVNPAARRAPELGALAARLFRRAGVRCDLVPTLRPGHAAELAAGRGGDYGAVFALGGDGTAMEVVGALAHSGVVVGVLPGGTGNLVARALGVPLRLDRAVAALLAGEPAAIDLGMFDDGRHFAFSAGIGVDARMITETPPALKRRWGVWGYAAIAARAVLQRIPVRARVDVDGEVTEHEAAAVIVANFGGVLSDLLRFGPDIRPDDGRLDLCVFAPSGTADAVRIAWSMLRERIRPITGAVYRAGRRFTIDCDPPQVVQADGEVVGRTPVRLAVAPGAARLLVPRRG